MEDQKKHSKVLKITQGEPQRGLVRSFIDHLKRSLKRRNFERIPSEMAQCAKKLGHYGAQQYHHQK